MMAGLVSGVALAVQEPIAKTFVVKALAACISVAPVLDRLSSAIERRPHREGQQTVPGQRRRRVGYAAFNYNAASDTFKSATENGAPPQSNDAKCGVARHAIAQSKDYIFTVYQKR
jgi:hypothetical protein